MRKLILSLLGVMICCASFAYVNPDCTVWTSNMNKVLKVWQNGTMVQEWVACKPGIKTPHTTLNHIICYSNPFEGHTTTEGYFITVDHVYPPIAVPLVSKMDTRNYIQDISKVKDIVLTLPKHDATVTCNLVKSFP